MPPIDIDRNLLFGVIALQDDLIDPGRFTDVCAGWAVRMETPLADLLIERGWITAEDRRAIEGKIERKVRKHRGDVRACLGEVAGDEARDSIRAVDHPEIRKSLGGLAPAAGHVLVETLVPPYRQEGPRYSITRLHAEGGLGKVWLAHDGDLNREVALKEIQPDRADHPETSRRFLREARITGQLEHPNIVPVYELARRKEDDQPYYVMRFVRGQTLRVAIAEFHRARGQGPRDRLGFQKLLGAFINVCQAVGYAHSRGVIHRDLKPENVVFGGFGEVMVLDWGLAKVVDRPEDPGREDAAPPVAVGAEGPRDATLGTVGTPSYMAPEQVEGRHDLIDAKTDVYALGGILFEILTGRPPAEGGTTAEVFAKILAGEIPRARAIEPTAPRELEAIAAKALSRDRARRYARAAELAEEVRRWIADEPVAAAPETPLRRLARWDRRHRTWVRAGMGALLLITGGSIASAMAIRQSWNREKLAHQRADARFGQVRELAHTFLFDFHDRVERLAGSTPIRRFIVEKGREYSDKLREEAGDDPELLHDLAVAYGKSGDILGGPHGSNLNDSPAALASYRKSLEVAEEHARKHPGNIVAHRDRLIALNSIAGLLEATGRTADALRSYEQSNAILDQLIRSFPKEDWRRDRAVSLGRLADTQAELGRASEALASARRAVELNDAYARAVPGDPQRRRDHAVSLQNLGMIQVNLGQTGAALASVSAARDEFERLSHDHPQDAPLRRDLLVATNAVGDLKARSGRVGEARESFQSALETARVLAEADPTNALARGDLAIGHERLGGVLVLLNRPGEALAHFRASRATQQALVAANPRSVRGQRGLSVAQEKCGDMELRTGQVEEARKSYGDCLSIRRKIAEADPASVPARRDLAIAHKKLGTVFAAGNQAKEALASHEEALRIRRDVSRADAKDARDRRAVVLSLQDVGDMKLRLGRIDEATAAFEEALRIARSIADADPRNASEQQNLGVCLDRQGKVMAQLGRLDDALASYRESLKIREALVALDPLNAGDKRDLSVVCEHLGRLLEKMKRPDQALEYHRRRMALALDLERIDPKDTSARLDLSTAHEALGDSLRDQGKADEALASYRECRRIREGLAAENPENPEFQHVLAVIYERFGDLAAVAGRDREAIDFYDKILAIRKRQADRAPGDADARHDLATAYHRRGYIEAKFAEDERRGREERVAHYRESRDWQRRAIGEFTEMKRLGQLPGARSAIIEELEKLVADCDARIRALGQPEPKKP